MFVVPQYRQNVKNILRYVNLFQKNGLVNKITSRTFLSEEFKCTSEWQARLDAPYMQKINLDTFYYDIEQNFSNFGKTSAIDIDLFANKVTNETEQHLDEINILLRKLRLTEEATNVLDSTSHAVIRNFTDAGQINGLIKILDNRLEYGVFLDHYIASYLLNILIEKKDFVAAAKVAGQLMLQEDLSNELSKSLALYSCYKFLENPQTFYDKPAVENDKQDEKEEIKKVRVKFLRNEFFDDHFDVKNHFHIVGKTLLAISKTLNNHLTHDINFLGNLYYEKYENCIQILNKESNHLHKNVIEMGLKHLESIVNENKDLETNETFNAVKDLVSNLSNKNSENNESNFVDILEKYVKEVASKCEKSELENQKLIYNDWVKLREVKLNEEIQRLDRVKRMIEVEKITKEMETEEQKLWFFENEDKIDLQIDNKIVRYPKRWFGKKKKPRVVDQDYIPPEIVKGRKL